jgi:hypothetical protein
MTKREPAVITNLTRTVARCCARRTRTVSGPSILNQTALTSGL